MKIINNVPIFIKKLLRIYFGKRVARSAAELSYFLTLSVFPMLICLYAMLGNLLPDAESMLKSIDGLIPEGTMKVINDYIGYITNYTSPAMLTAGLILMASSSAAAFRALHHIMGDIQGEARFSGIVSLVVSFMFSLIFLTVIYFSVVVIVTGGWFLEFIDEHLNFVSIAGAWTWIRFLLMFLVLLVIIYGIYRITATRGTEHTLAPGAMIAAVVLVAVSILFSWFIGMSARYPLVYGSLASIIVLMFWLYVCGTVVIMGNAVNVVIREMRKPAAKK